MLLIYLIIDCTFYVDIFITKNDYLINGKKSEINNIENIDSLRTYAKADLVALRVTHKQYSENTIQNIYLIFGIIIIQIVLWIFSFKANLKSNIEKR